MLPEATGIFGFPKHGFMDNGHATPGIYDTPGGTKIHAHYDCGADTQWQSSNGISLLKMPGIAAVTRTPEEQARDAASSYEWRNYSLIINNTLNGKDLHWPTGSAVDDRRHGAVYIDGNGVPWGVNVIALSSGSTSWNVGVYLRCLFGRFSTYRTFPMIHKELAIDTQFFGSMGGGDPVCDRTTGHMLTRNSTGSRMFAHIYSKKTSPILNSLGMGELFHCEDDKYLELIGVYDIQISGDGLISEDENELGSGITATITSYKDINDCYSTTNDLTSETDFSLGGWPNDKRVTLRLLSTDDYWPLCVDSCVQFGPVQGEINHYAMPHLNNVGIGYNGGSRWDRLYRCTFDADDNVVEIMLRSEDKNFYSYAHTPASDFSIETHWPGTFGAPCVGGKCFTPPGSTREDTVIGGGSETLVKTSIKYYRQQVLFNGTPVYNFEYEKKYVTTEAGYPLTPVGPSYTHWYQMDQSVVVTETINGVSHDRPTRYIPHIYCMDLLGVYAYMEDGTHDHRYILSSVTSPDGEDDTNELTVITQSGAPNLEIPKLGGTYQPETQEAEWYEPGITDQGEDHTFSFV